MASNRKSSDTADEDTEGQEIQYAGDALTLDLPEQGSTLESAPDGGPRAWFIVLSCALINTFLAIIFVLIRASLLIDEGDDIMTVDTGIDSDTLSDVSDQFLDMAHLYAPFAAFTMIFLGYRPTVIIGAGVIMVTLFFLSYLGDADTEHFIKFLIYGPTAAGISFIQLGVLIPVLEYFTTKRLKALFLSRLGMYLGEILLIGFFFIPDLTFKWRVCLRSCSALCIGIALLGLTLKDLKLKMNDDDSTTFVQKTLGLANRDVLRNVLVWSLCLVYLFYHWGIEPGEAMFSNFDTAAKLNFGGNLAKALLFGLSQQIGMLIGSLLAWIFKKFALDEESLFYSAKLRSISLTFILGVLILNTSTMGLGCFIAPSAFKFSYFFPFSLTYGALFTFNEALRDDLIPVLFGRDNIRIVEGLLFLAVGIGGVVTNEISAKIEENAGFDKVYYYAGGILLFSTCVTATVLYLKRSKLLDQATAKLKGNSVSPLNQSTEIRQTSNGNVNNNLETRGTS